MGMNSIEYLGGGDELRVFTVILLQLLDHVDDVDVR